MRRGNNYRKRIFEGNKRPLSSTLNFTVEKLRPQRGVMILPGSHSKSAIESEAIQIIGCRPCQFHYINPTSECWDLWFPTWEIFHSQKLAGNENSLLFLLSHSHHPPCQPCPLTSMCSSHTGLPSCHPGQTNLFLLFYLLRICLTSSHHSNVTCSESPPPTLYLK